MKNLSISLISPYLNIPINYHHEVQSLLYGILRESGGEKWHDTVAYGARQYKLFTFSSLRGAKQIVNARLRFERMIYLDVRSVRDELCDSLLDALNVGNDSTRIFHTVSYRGCASGRRYKARAVRATKAYYTICRGGITSATQ